MTSQNHINAYDQTTIIALLKQQNDLLTQLLNSTPSTPRKPIPMKRLSLKQQLREDFKNAFEKKWRL